MQPLSPLDGRYASKVAALRPFFSEDALIKARLTIEIRYLEALAAEKGISEFTLTATDKKLLQSIIDNFDAKEAEKIRGIEATTKHDVKAVEYYLREKLKNLKTEFIHFALTSEDVNNLSYGILIRDALEEVIRPDLKKIIATLSSLATGTKNIRMLSLTHGQPATPTTLGKEIMVSVERLERQLDQLTAFRMNGKFGGAVANYMAHQSAYPDVAWEKFGAAFIKSFKLEPITHATQINSHDDVAELSHIVIRINTILTGFCRDVWTYISRGVFIQKVIAGEVGSSTMPHKVNPIDFENAEGNLGLSSALFNHFAEKLPISRLQRDLTDSTVQRNIGVAFGYHTLALSSLSKGLTKITVDKNKLAEELSAHPEVLTEAIQTVMRKHGHADAYEQMKAVSRGKHVTFTELHDFVENLDIPQADKKRLQELFKSFKGTK